MNKQFDYNKFKLTYQMSALVDIYHKLIITDRPMSKSEIEDLIFERIEELKSQINKKGE